MGPQIEKAQCSIKNIKNPEKLVDICLRKKLRSKNTYDLISVRELKNTIFSTNTSYIF